MRTFLESKHLAKEKVLDSQILTPARTAKQMSFVRSSVV
jgi:hypothetical protein